MTLLFFCAQQSFAQTSNYNRTGEFEKRETIRDTIIRNIVHGFELYGNANNPQKPYIESMYGNDSMATDFIKGVQEKCSALKINLLKSNFAGNIIDFRFWYPDSVQMDYRIFLKKEENTDYVTNGKELVPLKNPNYSKIEYAFKKFKSINDEWKKDWEYRIVKTRLKKEPYYYEDFYDTDDTFQLYANIVAHFIKADLDIPQYWSIRLAENLSEGHNLQYFKKKLLATGLHPKKGKVVDINNGKRIYLMETIPPHNKYFDPLFMVTPNWQTD